MLMVDGSWDTWPDPSTVTESCNIQAIVTPKTLEKHCTIRPYFRLNLCPELQAKKKRCRVWKNIAVQRCHALWEVNQLEHGNSKHSVWIASYVISNQIQYKTKQLIRIDLIPKNDVYGQESDLWQTRVVIKNIITMIAFAIHHVYSRL